MPLNATEPFVSIPAEGVEIYTAPIATDGSRGSRREAEKAATARLVTTQFGPGATVAHSPDGAPRLILPDTATTAPEISISHSLHTVALAVGRAGRPIGVDIELPRQQLVRVGLLIVGEQRDISLWQIYNLIVKQPMRPKVLLT